MKLALGTAQFGGIYGIANKEGKVLRNEVEAIIGHAKRSGMDTLDTATAYGDSERRLGEIGVQDWRVVSKLPVVPTECSDISQWVRESVKQSLHRLKVDRLYGLLLHRPQQLLQQRGEQIYNALHQLKRDGFSQKVGISVYDPIELDAICSRYYIDLVQAPFNVFDRRLIDSGWLTRLASQNTELHVRSIFLQGLLLMRGKERPKKFDRWHTVFEHWDAELAERNISPLEICVAHVLSFPEISRVIVGVDSSKQLSEIVTASSRVPFKLSNESWTTDINLLNPSLWPKS